MADIATLGIAIDASGVAPAVKSLDDLTAAGARAQARADAMGESIRRQNASMAQTTSATQASASALDRNSASYRALDAELEKFLAANNKVYAAQRTLDQGNDLLNQGVKAGLISQQTATSTLEALTKKYSESGEGAKGASVSTSFLTRELRALGDEAAAGRWRQFDGTLANVGSRLLGLGPAALVAAGGVIGVGVAIGLIVDRENALEKAILGIENGFRASGGAAQLGEGQVREYIKTLSLLPGVSRDAAEKSLTELSRIPEITTTQFQASAKILADFAALEGKDLPSAAKDLATALADPASGAKRLGEQFGALTLQQRVLIDDYLLHGERAKAVDVILAGVATTSKGMADNALTPLGRATNEVAVAWQKLNDRFADDAASKNAETGVSRLISRFAEFISYLAEARIKFKELYDSLPAGSPKQMALGGLMPAPGGKQMPSGSDLLNGPAPSTATGVSGRLLGPDGQPMYPDGGATSAAAAQTATAAATNETNKAIEAQLRGLHNLGDGYSGTAERMLKLNADLKQFQAGLAATSDPKEQGYLNAKIKAVQEQIDNANKRGSGAPPPLSIGLDKAEADTQVKLVDFIYAKQKEAFDESQKLADFYHAAGIDSDRQYFDKRLALFDANAAAEEQRLKDDIAIKRKLDETYASAAPASGAQGLEVAKAREVNLQAILDLEHKEELVRMRMASDRSLLVLDEQRLERVTATNVAMAKTQEITSKLGEQEAAFNAQVKLGLMSQSDAIVARTSATQQAISALQTQVSVLEQLKATNAAANDSAAVEKQATAINKLNAEILKLSADLDPIGQKLNQAFNNDLVTFFDKFGSGGIKTFKDLKTAAGEFFLSLASQIAHEANQKLADNILQSLGGSANSATGTTGGLGGVVSSLLGLGPKGGTSATKPTSSAVSLPTGATSGASDDEMGDFIRKIGTANAGLDTFSSNGLGGATKSAAGLIEKQIIGTTTETTATSVTTSATSALTALTQAAYQAATALSSVGGGGGGGGGGLGGLGGMFGGGSSAGAGIGSATAEDVAAAAGGNSVAEAGLMFLHGGGIVGRDFAYKRQVSVSSADIAAAPRFHGGGMVGGHLPGYGERLVMAKDGEEVLTEQDPRHRNNGGRSRGGISVTNHFTVQPNVDRSSQQQIAERAHRSVTSAAARNR